MNNEFFNKKVRIAKSFITRKVDNTMLVYDEETGDMYELNETSEYILKRIKQNISLKEIYNELCDEYDGDTDIIMQDYLTLIFQLKENGIIIDC